VRLVLWRLVRRHARWLLGLCPTLPDHTACPHCLTTPCQTCSPSTAHPRHPPAAAAPTSDADVQPQIQKQLQLSSVPREAVHHARHAAAVRPVTNGAHAFA